MLYAKRATFIIAALVRVAVFARLIAKMKRGIEYRPENFMGFVTLKKTTRKGR